MLKVIFMGTPDFARESLKEVYEAGYKVLAVVTNPDKPKGRGMKLIPSPVKEYALEKDLEIYQPEKIKKNEEFINKIKNLKPDVICVVAYGSLLPKYRGAAPIQWAVLNGDKKTGVTTMYMDVGMDTGDMILKEEVSIGEDETTGELWERLSKIGGKLLIKTLKEIEKGTAPREKQGEDYSLAPMLSKEMAKINWEEMNAKEIKNLVRGLNPIMGAYSTLDGKKIKFWKVQVESNSQILEKFPELKEYEYRLNGLTPGTILFADDKKGLYIKAIDGIISVLELQAENSKKMLISDFLRGTKLQAGTIFE